MLQSLVDVAPKVFFRLFVESLTFASYLLLKLMYPYKAPRNSTGNKFQFFIMLFICIGNFVEPFCGTLNIFLSHLCYGKIGLGFRCILDGSVTYYVETYYLLAAFITREVLRECLNKIYTWIFIVLLFLIAVILTSLLIFGIGKCKSQPNYFLCCLNWKAEFISDKIYFINILFVGLVLSTLTILICYNAEYEENKNGRCSIIETKTVLNVTLLRIAMPYFYGVFIIIKL